MLGWLEAADMIFEKAFELAKSDLLKGKIKRDWSMVAVARRNYKLAFSQLEESKKFLQSNGHVLVGEARNEYYATIAFIGEVHGLAGDRKHGAECLELACERLRDISPYELNSLMRLMAVASPIRRLAVAKRAWHLARKAKHRGRMLQIITTVLSTRLARRLSRR
jgi:tetratricopeptide (TPR) repeat protein